jgi:hypothetical protein
MKNSNAKPTQQYIALWKECKANGSIPATPMTSSDQITASTTLKEILMRMESIGLADEAAKKIESRNITGLSTKRFWIIPSDETPTVVDLETLEEVEKLAAIKIFLN